MKSQDSYIKTLESQNEELRDALSICERILEYRDGFRIHKCECVVTLAPHIDESHIFKSGLSVNGVYIFHEYPLTITYEYVKNKIKELSQHYTVVSICFNKSVNARWVWSVEARFNDDKTWTVFAHTHIKFGSKTGTTINPTKKNIKKFLERLAATPYDEFL